MSGLAGATNFDKGGVTDRSVIIVNIAVHGGSYHKLIHLCKYLNANGISCLLILNSSPPLGLQVGLDIDDAQREKLRTDGVFVMEYDEIRKYLEDTPARLYVFDGLKTAKIKDLIDLVRARHNAKTAQIGSLYHEFIYWGADYVFLQHPLSLWFLNEVYHWKGHKDLYRARSIIFAGNIFSEPVCNEWTSEIRSKSDLCDKYNLDVEKPICLWLPDRHDGNRPVYRSVVDTVKAASYNLVVKPHPWEYKNLKHGFDPKYGEGVTSANKYECEAIREQDSSWFFKYSDIVIIGTSTVGMEMPYWRKPFIYINDGSWRNRVVESCSVWLTDPSKVGEALMEGSRLRFKEEDYQKALAYLHPDAKRTSFELHLEGIRAALEDTGTSKRIGSNRKVARLYSGKAPNSWKIYEEHMLKRIIGQIKQNSLVQKSYSKLKGMLR
ncbi:hypothetical protein MNBD_NITROSPINAE02-1765 [hydrothermal vent metagenome]|uniref:CDP-Glycerol:Poly(Glycerophosphate) glycerophosphotransferase n=1 Tax=hydrothermal vent metagenome TaxID=652676 RepID=A0A3B1CM52_9ZZZZ